MALALFSDSLDNNKRLINNKTNIQLGTFALSTHAAFGWFQERKCRRAKQRRSACAHIDIRRTCFRCLIKRKFKNSRYFVYSPCSATLPCVMFTNINPFGHVTYIMPFGHVTNIMPFGHVTYITPFGHVTYVMLFGHVTYIMPFGRVTYIMLFGHVT